jgi:hypothetical protein
MIPALVLATALAQPPDPNRWTPLDTSLVGVLVAEQLYDLTTMRWCQKQFGTYCQEKDPVLGKYPGPVRLYGTAAISLVAFIAISYVLPTHWREGFMGLVIGGEATVLATNPREIQFHFAF